MKILQNGFFEEHTLKVAKSLIGKVIYRKYKNNWLKVQIIETEAYLLTDKASHSSLGFTEKKRALFMPVGTIYMYYSRGKDSLNISTGNIGDGVLIKSGIPFMESKEDKQMINVMKNLNLKNGKYRDTMFLCSGQTLLTKSLNITVKEFDKKAFSKHFFITDTGYIPPNLIVTKRLGIPTQRDENLPFRFIDLKYVRYCSKSPLTKSSKENIDYKII